MFKLIYFRESIMPMTHEEARQKVCAICINGHGAKASRGATAREEELISTHVIRGYRRSNMFFPSGICKWCIFDLRSIDEGKPVKLLLPESYDTEMPRQTRSSGMECSCRLCWLAKLWGGALKKWQARVRGKEKPKVVRLCQECYHGIEDGRSHTCSASTLEAVRNLTASIPLEIREKLALETLREKAAHSAGGDVALPQAQGGKLVPVQMGGGSSIVTKPMPQISCKEVLTMAASAHLTGKQTDSVLADIRAKLGRSVIEPGVKSARVHHNSQYREFFTAAVVKFWSSEGELVNKPFFWCSSLEAFLNNVAEKRGRMLEECRLKVGGDTGKGFFKLTASLYVPASRTAPISKKMRRSREDGVSPVGKFAETGQRMILLLAWCKGIPESAENLEIVYNAVNLHSLQFIMTGDYKLLMPSFGLMSCSSTHPCLYCARSRVKGVWEEVDETCDVLRTFSRIEIMSSSWMEAGSKDTTYWTSKFESCTGPILVWGQGDTPETRVLDKVTPPTVHNLLALNTVLDHLSKFWPGNLKEDLKKELNIIPHSYQGKDGAFAGPECDKFLSSLRTG